MKILVCIKQVPDMESKFRIDENGVWYSKSDLAWRMNEYDEYAVEQAVQLKEQIGNGDITVLSVGGEQVKETIKKALAMGCDRGVHIVDEDAGLKDPFQIATIIAECAKDNDFDVVFTGMQSQDRGSGQVGILLSEMIGASGVSTVVEFEYDNGAIKAKRELEGGMKACVTVSCPAVITCQLGLNSPRYPTLPNIMKAKKKELISTSLSDLQSIEPLGDTTRIFYPEKKGSGLVLEGDVGDLADQVISILKEKTSILS